MIPIEALDIARQFRDVPKQYKNFTVTGYDTETVGGKCELLATEGDYIHPNGMDQILAFLTSKKRRGSIGFFYNLGYDFHAILKHLPEHKWQEIYHQGKISWGEFYELSWIPGKILFIRRKTGSKSRTFPFYDISQFYGRRRLDDVAQEYLGERKQSHQWDMSNVTPELCRDPLFVKYCRRDAYLAGQLAQFWIDLCRQMGVYTKTFASPASVSSWYFRHKCDIPTINRYRSGKNQLVLHTAWQAVNGPLITTYRRGYHEKVYEYDLNSAYPDAIRKLLDLRLGYFVFSRKDEPHPDAFYGYIRCSVFIFHDSPAWFIPPFPMERKTLSKYCPYGAFETTLTLQEYLTYKDDYKIRIRHGFYWIPNGVAYPFKSAIEELYQTRLETSDANINYFCKIMLNGFYGKTLEKYKDHESQTIKTGQLFNPFYAAQILSACRIKVWKQLRKMKPETIVATYTDSIISTEPLSFDDNKELGAWSYEGAGESLIIGCGVYTNRLNGRIKTKLRGFHTTSHVDLFDVLREQHKADFIRIPVTKNIKPLESLIQGIPDQMNRIIEDHREIFINFDTKRLWLKGGLKKAGQLLGASYESVPMLFDTIGV